MELVLFRYLDISGCTDWVGRIRFTWIVLNFNGSDSYLNTQKLVLWNINFNDCNIPFTFIVPLQSRVNVNNQKYRHMGPELYATVRGVRMFCVPNRGWSLMRCFQHEALMRSLATRLRPHWALSQYWQWNPNLDPINTGLR